MSSLILMKINKNNSNT